MILSGKEIINEVGNGNIVITPFDEKRVNPNSYNVTLNNRLLVYEEGLKLDMKADQSNRMQEKIIQPHGFLLRPGELYLARTNEYTETHGFVPMLEGRSSIGRLGMFIHVTAGFGDNGFKGFWTLEVTVVRPLVIYADIEIGQLYFHTIKGECDTYKNGKYQNNNGIQASQLFKDFQK